MARPTLIVVSGPSRSGTTTLAHALAQAIPCPAICRDEIKEGMVHAEDGDFQAAPGDPLTQRTLPLFFEAVRVMLAGGVTVVAEASFQHEVWKAWLEPLAELAQLRIVQCHVDAAVARERDRAAGRRRAHVVVREWEEAFASFERLSIPAPSIDVDTTDGYAPGLVEIVEFVNRQ